MYYQWYRLAAHHLQISRVIHVTPPHHVVPQAHALMTRLPSVNPSPTTFPALLLLVSGGHNMLVLSEGVGKHRIIGTTLDDRCGCVGVELETGRCVSIAQTINHSRSLTHYTLYVPFLTWPNALHTHSDSAPPPQRRRVL